MNPLDIISQGAKLNPTLTKILFGVPLVAAALAITLKLVEDTQTAIIGGIIVIILAIVTFVVSRLGETFDGLKSTVIWFVRCCLLLFIVVSVLTVTAIFFQWPRPLSCLVREECSRLAGNELNAQAPATTPAAPMASAAAQSVAREKYTVYIQFAGFDRDEVVPLTDKLKSAGWKVPREERIGTAKGLFEVRYRSEKDKAAAELLAAEIARAGISRREVKIRQIPIIAENTLEVWISK